MALLHGALNVVALLLIFVWFVPGGLVLHLLVVPACWLWPGRRATLVSWYMKGMSAGILALLRLGGARFKRTGRLPTREPVLIVANHQSLVDILTVTLLADPYVPGFVTRRRYARFIPVISPCIRLSGCPVIDPKRDPKGALGVIVDSARRLEHGLLIFPEGHRSLDGEVRPFHSAGLRGVLDARRLPVYLVVSDGFWTCRRLVDFVFGVHKIQGQTEIVGPLTPPEKAEEIPAFASGLRDRLVEHLRQMRERRHE